MKQGKFINLLISAIFRILISGSIRLKASRKRYVEINGVLECEHTIEKSSSHFGGIVCL